MVLTFTIIFAVIQTIVQGCCFFMFMFNTCIPYFKEKYDEDSKLIPLSHREHMVY